MRTFDRLRNLPLKIDGVRRGLLELQVSPELRRVTSVISLTGDGEEGLGEDVIYEPEAHEGPRPFEQSEAWIDDHTLESFSALLDGIPDLQRWGYEAAALDLALRQAGLALHEVLEREPRPVRFVVSTRPERIGSYRALHPNLRFKLDPESRWDESLVEELVALEGVDVLDFKEAYTWRAPERTPGADLYRVLVDALPDALIEDPGLDDPEKAAILEPHRDRITWDAPIHSVADVDALRFPPRTLNSKPSRFGSLGGLFDFYDTCAERGIALYGGGQFELGPGRGQIQYLASLFHPDAPNDVAPGGYNEPEPPAELAGSPLPPAPDKTGFRWLRA
jgi:hypothetical protein